MPVASMTWGPISIRTGAVVVAVLATVSSVIVEVRTTAGALRATGEPVSVTLSDSATSRAPAGRRPRLAVSSHGAVPVG